MISQIEKVIVDAELAHSIHRCLTYPSATFFFIKIAVPITSRFWSFGTVDMQSADFMLHDNIGQPIGSELSKKLK